MIIPHIGNLQYFGGYHIRKDQIMLLPFSSYDLPITHKLICIFMNLIVLYPVYFNRPQSI